MESLQRRMFLVNFVLAAISTRLILRPASYTVWGYIEHNSANIDSLCDKVAYKALMNEMAGNGKILKQEKHYETHRIATKTVFSNKSSYEDFMRKITDMRVYDLSKVPHSSVKIYSIDQDGIHRQLA